MIGLTLRGNWDQLTGSKAGVYLCGLATAGAGTMDLIWGDFEPAHQPIGALGDHIPGRVIFAYVTAVWMIAAGFALISRRTARAGGIATCIIYFVFGMFWLPRFYTAPHVLGVHLTVFVGVLGGIFTQWIVAAAGLIVYSSLARPGLTWPQRQITLAVAVFGIGSVLFGLAHLTGVKFVARMIPRWMPLGGAFWVVVSGTAFVLAGLAILTGNLRGLATRLLALMLLIFEVILIPLVFANPRDHVAWGANAYNLAAAGAVLIFAAFIGNHNIEREQEPESHFVKVS